MKQGAYLFEVMIKAIDGNCHTFATVGANINDVYYNFNDKTYNGQPIEIIQVERKDKIIEGYTSNLELNPEYKPTEENQTSPIEPDMLAPGD